MVWMLAADRDGLVPDDAFLVQKLCQMEAVPDLELFIHHGFIERRHDGAMMTPERRQDDHLDKRREEKKREEKNPPTPKGGEGFEKFWRAYPKRASKGQAEKTWRRLRPNEQLIETIIQAIERAKTSEKWRKDGGQFIPYPATWLNAKGWEDEPEVSFVAVKPDKYAHLYE